MPRYLLCGAGVPRAYKADSPDEITKKFTSFRSLSQNAIINGARRIQFAILVELHAEMGRTKSESPERIVKATVNDYGDMNQGRKLDMFHSEQFTPQEGLNLKASDLHIAQVDTGMLNEHMETSEKEKVQAQFELYRTKTEAKELALQIQESKAMAMSQKLELQLLQNPQKNREKRLSLKEISEHRYLEAMQELTRVKQEISRVKLDVISARESKIKAEKDMSDSGLLNRSCQDSVEELRRDIEDANEEQVLVELARIEAEKEYTELEAQRKAEATQFRTNIEMARKRIKELRKEIKCAKEIEMKLAMTTSDVNVLQTEMELVRAMEKSFEPSLKGNNTGSRKQEKEENGVSLQSAEAEMKEAKKELASIKEEGFQLMAAMDIVRTELMNVTKEIERLKKLEKKVDSAVQSLNSKLLKAKTKLESASVADERTKAIVSNLSTALQQLLSDIEAATKEKESLAEETKTVKIEIEKSNLSFNAADMKLQATMQELEAVKASEAMAMEKLKSVAERTLRARVSSSAHISAIRISEWEYDYLSRRAAAAQEVADIKVAAAQAWIKALKVEEKEILIETELAQKEIKELIVVKECELQNAQQCYADPEEEKGVQSNTMVVETEDEPVNLQLAISKPRKSIREIGVITASQRRVNMRRSSASLGTRQAARSPSFTIKKRRKVMPNLGLLLRGRRNVKQK